MLEKNVWIIYPHGYGGSYISWAISASDQDLAPLTVKDPVNRTNSLNFGGAGTSHLHTRIPTHQCIEYAMIWRVITQPKDKKNFIILGDNETLGRTLQTILATDSDPVIVIIHHSNDPDITAYGCINQLTKWPIVAMGLQKRLNSSWGNKDAAVGNWDWDVTNCQKDLRCRNDIAVGYTPWHMSMAPVDLSNLGRHRYEFDSYLNSFLTPRKKYHSHEVNEDNYIFWDDIPIEKIYQISTNDISNGKFLLWFENFLSHSKCSNNYNIDHVRQIHQTYIDAQENLQWFDSIKQWNQTGELDSYLTGHSMVQGFVIRKILSEVGFVITDDRKINRFQSWYRTIKDLQWPDIVEQDFETLRPEWQQECIEKFNYKPLLQNVETIHYRNLLRDWRNMSVNDINEIYQKIKIYMGP